MKLTSSDFERAWQTIDGQKTDFEDGWKLVDYGDRVHLAKGPHSHRVAPFDVSLAVDDGRLYVAMPGQLFSVPLDAVKGSAERIEGVVSAAAAVRAGEQR